MELNLIIIIAVLVICSIFLLYLYVASKRVVNKLKEEVNKLKEKVLRYENEEEEINGWINNIKGTLTLFKELKKAVAELSDSDFNLDSLINLMSNHLWLQSKSIDKLRLAFEKAKTLKDNADKIELLQRRINGFYGDLNEHLMGQNSETRIRTEYLELTLMMIDVIDSIDNPNFVDSLQGNNVKLLTKEITSDEAYEKATEATFDDRQTPQWARNLKKCLFEWSRNDGEYLIENKSYLLKGYKFSCDH